eukprot:1325558-Rhodomonas_salina.1
MGQQGANSSPSRSPSKQQGGTNKSQLKCLKCKIHHPDGLSSCLHYEQTKAIIEQGKQKYHKFQKKGKGDKVPDKSPGKQLPGVPDVTAFLADAVAPSPETQSLGQELFSTFAKGNPPAWAARTDPGIKIEELSNAYTENGEYIEVNKQSSMMDTPAHIVAATRLDVRLHCVAWTILILLYALNL